jgi:hypothetical protein
LLELSENICVDESWALVSDPAQHDAVAHRNDLETWSVALEPSDDEFESIFPVERALLVPGLGVDKPAICVFSNEFRLRFDPIELTMTDEIKRFGAVRTSRWSSRR